MLLIDPVESFILSYDAAIENGHSVYMEPSPCINGHVSGWYVGNRCCVECRKLHMLQDAVKNSHNLCSKAADRKSVV